MNLNNRIKAAKIGYVMISVLLCVMGIVLIAVPDFSVTLLCKLGGGIMMLFGLVKIIGYCSKDLYRLAFQFDLAFGILFMALGIILIIRTDVMVNLICIVMGICVLADALLKIQISIDSKTFGNPDYPFCRFIPLHRDRDKDKVRVLVSISDPCLLGRPVRRSIHVCN